MDFVKDSGVTMGVVDCEGFGSDSGSGGLCEGFGSDSGVFCSDDDSDGSGDGKGSLLVDIDKSGEATE